MESIAAVLRTDPASLEPYLARQGSYEDFVFAALNTAFMRDGAFVRIPAGVALEKPIHLLYYSTRLDTPVVSHPRNVIVAGSGSRAVILESYAGPDGTAYFTNGVTEVSAGEGSDIGHCKLQREGRDAFHVSFTRLDLDRDCRYGHHMAALGGGLVRNELNGWLNGEQIHCTMNGLSLVDGQRLVDNHTLMVHAKPNCESHEVYKSILDEHGRAVFAARFSWPRMPRRPIRNRPTRPCCCPTRRKTRPCRSWKSTPTTSNARTARRPASWTTGPLYLRARGINPEDARELLTYAFASEIVDSIPSPPCAGTGSCVAQAAVIQPHERESV